MGFASPGRPSKAKNEQDTGPSPELTSSRRKALLELLGDVLKAQETR
jgi:hypothetical protein